MIAKRKCTLNDSDRTTLTLKRKKNKTNQNCASKCICALAYYYFYDYSNRNTLHSIACSIADIIKTKNEAGDISVFLCCTFSFVRRTVVDDFLFHFGIEIANLSSFIFSIGEANKCACVEWISGKKSKNKSSTQENKADSILRYFDVFFVLNALTYVKFGRYQLKLIWLSKK